MSIKEIGNYLYISYKKDKQRSKPRIFYRKNGFCLRYPQALNIEIFILPKLENLSEKLLVVTNYTNKKDREDRTIYYYNKIKSDKDIIEKLIDNLLNIRRLAINKQAKQINILIHKLERFQPNYNSDIRNGDVQVQPS